MSKELKNITRSEKFKQLASKRTNNVLKTLKVLGNCANASAYEYTEEEVKKIFRAIEEKLSETKARFKFKKKEKFEL